MQLSSWAICHLIPTIVLFLLLTVTGIFSFLQLSVNATPSVSFPIATVSISRTGASPDEMENSVTRQVKTAMAGVTGVRHITSKTSDGISITTMEFRLGTDTDRAVNDVRNTAAQVRDDLPQGINEPLVERVEMEGGALGYYALESPEMDAAALSWSVDDTVSRRLLAVSGMQKVVQSGGSKCEIIMQLRPDHLKALGITANQVNSQLTQTNASIPAGRTVQDGSELNLRMLASTKGVDALADTSIALSDDRQAKLSELTHVSDSHAEVRSHVRLNGHRMVGFNMFRAEGSNDTEMVKGVEATVAELQKQRPEIRIRNVLSTVESTRESYDTAIDTLLESVLLTILVVFLFLRNWRSTLVAAVALPLSILPALVMMYAFDYTLNNVTPLDLTLAVGVLVDGTIIEIENIENHLTTGRHPFPTAIDAADAIGFAVVTIMGTIVAVLLPVSFISGVVGQYFSQFGITVSAAVLPPLLTTRLAASLLVAYLLQPRKGATSDERTHGFFMGSYLKLLTWVSQHRKTTILAGGLMLAASLVVLPLPPTGSIPKSGVGYNQVTISLPPGSTLAEADRALHALSDGIRRHPEVDAVYATAGNDGDIAKGELLMRLRAHGERDISQNAFERKLRGELARAPNIRFFFKDESAQRDINIIPIDDDAAKLSETARKLETQMRGIADAANVQIDKPLPRPELQTRLLSDEAARTGVTPQAMGNLLRIASIGGRNAESTRYNLSDRQISIRTALPENARNGAQTLRNLRVPSSNGGSVPLHTVAGTRYAAGSATIICSDRGRRTSVEADLNNGHTISEVLTQISTLPVMQNLPAGIRTPEYGDTEYMNEILSRFGMTMGFGILMVLVVLVLLFRDFLRPVTVITALPLSLSDALGELLLYSTALDLSSVIGILMLIGVITKNSILLVDFIIEERRRGTTRARAIYRSGAGRARPIIMTTIAMAADMLPSVFAGDSGATFRAPIAVVVICGLIVSTALSLVSVPVFYSLADDLRQWLAPRLTRLTPVTAEDRETAE